MNAQQLRNSILQEAIEGRLVPQDPNDEPASILLDRIRKEKERLVKVGKLKKKDLEVKPISEDEIPFEIPESWEWCRIAFFASVLGGKRIPAGRKLSQENTGHIYIRVSDMKDNTVSTNNLQFVPEDIYPTISKYVINKEDVYITVAGTIGRVGKIPPELDGANLTENADRLIFNFIDQDWLINCLQSIFVQTQIADVTTKVGQPKLAIARIQNLLTPLPPLAEQHRIVAKIEEVLPKVEEYGKAQDELNKLNEELPERLKKSILQEAIEGRLVPQDPNDEPASILLDRIRKEKEILVKEGKLKKSVLKEIPFSEDEEPFDIPDSWEWCKLGWIGDWGAGATPAKGNPDFYNNGTIPWLRTGELNNGFVYDSEIKVTPKALKKCSLRMCEIGDVLIAMYGATIGKVAIAGIQLTTNQACCACTPYGIYNKFLLYYLMASKKTFTEMGEGGAQPNISREKIVAFPFALPPLAEQHRIVAKIEELFAEIDKLKA